MENKERLCYVPKQLPEPIFNNILSLNLRFTLEMVIWNFVDKEHIEEYNVQASEKYDHWDTYTNFPHI